MAPHHTATVAAMVGGGSAMLRPGAVSLAHRGVLFLDEAPEFRWPCSTRCASRWSPGPSPSPGQRARSPSRPGSCWCWPPTRARAPSRPAPRAACKCTPSVRRRYLARLSGPLLDRIDVKVTVDRSTQAELMADRRFAEPSKVVAERVLLARERAAKRFGDTPWRSNAEIPSRALHTEFRRRRRR